MGVSFFFFVSLVFVSLCSLSFFLNKSRYFHRKKEKKNYPRVECKIAHLFVSFFVFNSVLSYHKKHITNFGSEER